MSIDEKYLSDQESCFLVWKVVFGVQTGWLKKLIHVEIRKYKMLLLKKNSFWKRQKCIHKSVSVVPGVGRLGDKIDDAKGELSSTGNENVIRHFE